MKLPLISLKLARARMISPLVMLSKRVGAEHVIDAVANNVVEVVVGLTDSRGVDVAIDYVSSTTTLTQAFASLGV